jgi:hypothetical protein
MGLLVISPVTRERCCGRKSRVCTLCISSDLEAPHERLSGALDVRQPVESAVPRSDSSRLRHLAATSPS